MQKPRLVRPGRKVSSNKHPLIYQVRLGFASGRKAQCAAATGAIPAGAAASAGVVSPSVLPETEGQVSDEDLWRASHPGSGLQDNAKRPRVFLPHGFKLMGEGGLWQEPSPTILQDL